MSALSLEKIEALAPDQASLGAARKLLKPAAWPALVSDGSGLVWGECQGSGATPYRVVISETDAGYKCTCPSRKFPCKHSLALMWMRVEGKATFAGGTAPEWVLDWQRRRRPGAVGAAESASNELDDNGNPRAARNLAQVPVDEPEEVDPKQEARAAAARERNRLEREQSIAAGLDDLDVWLADQLDAGLAGFAEHASKACRLIAQRLVDAKTPGLASRIENLPSRLYALPESQRGISAMEELGQLHLLTEAYRRQDELTPEMRADARREVGWIQTRESLLADEAAPRIVGRWRVAGTVSEVQPDRLRRLETWLWREDTQEEPCFAVLIDFVPVATGVARSVYSLGEKFEATLVFYSSPVLLRAQIASISSPAARCADSFDLPDWDLEESLNEYQRALGRKPWLGTWPLAFRHARLRRHGDQLFVCAATNERVAVPLASAQTAMAAPLLGLDSFDGVGLWDGYRLKLCLAETGLGRWEDQ